MTTEAATYHVVLIGIDRYPLVSGRDRSLNGCVNDIDAIEALLLTPPGFGLSPEHVRITRLAAANASHLSTSCFQHETLAPTKANIISVLRGLGSPIVKSSDRILIYYSGHGHEILVNDRRAWHEVLVFHNNVDLEYLFDFEINQLVNAIAARTSDLTIILDCCHSAGATRDLGANDSEETIRTLASDDASTEPLNLALDHSMAKDRAFGTHLLQATSPSYVVIAACQPHEKAYEGPRKNPPPRHGTLTYSILSLLNGKDANQRAQLRWMDLWPNLLAAVAERNAKINAEMNRNRPPQHPWLIGDSARRLFGGPWKPMDVGYHIAMQADGTYEIGAGILMGITDGAEIAVYGSEPPWFPAIGSLEDQPIGRLRVIRADAAYAVSVAVSAVFALPEGARGRLIKPGESEQLRVKLQPDDTTLQIRLEESPLLAVLPATAPDADIEVVMQSDGGWVIGNDMERAIAAIPPGEIQALRAGLEHYYRYNTVLRMAHRYSDPKLSNCLSVQLLNCNDAAVLQAQSPNTLADPDLPEATRDSERIYALYTGFRFCVKVINTSDYDLNVTLLNCSAGGLVEYLSDAVVRHGASYVMWLNNELGRPFEANPDKLPIDNQRAFTTDRLIAIGTTRHNLNLSYLELDKRVQEIVNDNLSTRGEKSMRSAGKTSLAPVDRWIATVTPVRYAS